MPLIDVTDDDGEVVKVPVPYGDDESIDAYLNSPDGEKAIKTFRASRDGTIPETLWSAMKSFPGGIANQIGDMFTVMSSPIQSSRNINQLIDGIVQIIDKDVLGTDLTGQYAEAVKSVPKNAMSGIAEKNISDSREAAAAFGDALNNKYGTIDNIKHTFATDSADILGLAASFFTGAGGVARFASASKAMKAAKVSSALARTDGVLSVIGKVTEPMNIAGVGLKLGGKATKAVGLNGLLKNSLKQIYKSKGRIEKHLMRRATKIQPSRQKKLAIELEDYTQTANRIEEWMLDKGVSGTVDSMIEQVRELKNKSRSELDAKLASNPTPFQSETVSNILDRSLEIRKGLTSQKSKDIIQKIEQWQIKHETDGLSLSEMNEVKRHLDSEEKMFKASGETSDARIAKNSAELRNELKRFIEDTAETQFGIPDVRELNKNTQIAKGAEQALVYSDFSTSNNKWLHITNSVILGGSIANPNIGVPVFVLNQIRESPAARTALAQAMRKISAKNIDKMGKELITGAVSPKTKLLLSQAINSSKFAMAKEASLKSAGLLKQNFPDLYTIGRPGLKTATGAAEAVESTEEEL